MIQSEGERAEKWPWTINKEEGQVAMGWLSALLSRNSVSFPLFVFPCFASSHLTFFLSL
jgi:hypothetical protein